MTAIKAKPFIVNDQPSYRFAELQRIPETQLVMAIPKRTWQRLVEYIPAYEAVTLAGRFGADPGDYEWEVLSDPAGLRWWRRTASGTETLFGLAVAVERKDIVELYAMVEIDETSIFWQEVIPGEAGNAMPAQAKLIARTEFRNEEEVLAEIYRNYFREAGMMTSEAPGQAACRKGTVREVELLKNAIKGVIERALKAPLPSEVAKRR